MFQIATIEFSVILITSSKEILLLSLFVVASVLLSTTISLTPPKILSSEKLIPVEKSRLVILISLSTLKLVIV